MIKYIKFKINNIFNIFLRHNNFPFYYKWFGKSQIGRGNVLILNDPCVLKDCEIKFIGANCTLIVEEHCELKGMKILIGGIGSKILIKRNTTINASLLQPTIINAMEGKCIEIGEDCMLSNSIEIHNSDYHSIINSKGERINTAKI